MTSSNFLFLSHALAYAHSPQRTVHEEFIDPDAAGAGLGLATISSMSTTPRGSAPSERERASRGFGFGFGFSTVPTEISSVAVAGVEPTSSASISSAARSRLAAFLCFLRSFRLARALSNFALGCSSIASSVRPTSSITWSTSSVASTGLGFDVSEIRSADASSGVAARRRRMSRRSSSTRRFFVKLNSGAVSRREKRGLPASSRTPPPASLMSFARSP